jgi:hypothetical protein
VKFPTRRFLAALLAAGVPVVAQAPAAGVIRNWGISLRDAASGRVQVRFSSRKAVPAKDGSGGLVAAVWDVTEMRLETFRPDETADFLIEAPDCRVNVATRDAASAGPFSARRESDGLRMTGTGFAFVAAEQRLSVSNDVRVEIRATLFRPQPAKP